MISCLFVYRWILYLIFLKKKRAPKTKIQEPKTVFFFNLKKKSKLMRKKNTDELQKKCKEKEKQMRHHNK